jgi:RNA polymerase sigma-70 factor (ECF subfamily)
VQSRAAAIIMGAMARHGNSSATNHLLLRLCGEPQALADLFARHKERLRRMVRLRLDPRLRGRFDSSRVLELVYRDVCQRITEYHADPSLPFFFWLRQVAGQRLRALADEHLADGQGDPAISLYRGALPEVNSVALAAQLLGQPTSATQAAARADLQIRLQDALNSMDPLDREILTLCHFEDLNNAEAALALGIEPKVASQRYVRAVKRLQEILRSIPGFGK